MRNKQGISIPNAVIQSGEDKFSWLRDIKTLSIGDLIELYAYAEAIVETVREPLMILDKDLRVKSVNKSFLDTFKVTKKSIYGKHIYNLNSGEWNIPALRKLLEDILPKNSHFNDFEVHHKFNKLGEKVMLLNARRIILEENNTKLILLAIEDVTLRKKLEQQKDEFVSIVSHELKTPLTSIKLFIQLVEKRLRARGDKQDSYFMKNVIKQTDRLSDLINELLHVGRIEAGELILHKKKVDLDKLIKRIVVDYQYTTENHTLVKEGEIKRKVFCDAYRIEQVLTNLITNAIKYSPNADKIIVKFGIKKDQVVISVQDFGLGIAKKDQLYIFERFYRTEKKKEQNIEGFGLGLYISSQIIQKHGGRMWVDSVKGKGSTFYFTLPLK
jgi:PAS domain S-box-containing protein